MKRGFALLVLSLFAISTVTAACDLEVTLINQDPYPAIPGEYVKAVFQLNGLSDPTCGTISFEFIEEFPFSLDPGVAKIKTIKSGTYARNYGSFAVIPFEIRVDKDALDGSSPVEVAFSSSTAFSKINDFNIEIKDVKTDFDVSVDNFVPAENKITFSILNIGKNDADAVLIEIPKQENIEVKGGNREIVGSLDSNDDTTFSFEALPKDGEINLNIFYSDSTGVRRSLEKTINYDSSYFKDRITDKKSTSGYIYLVILLIVAIIIWRIIAHRKKKKHERMKLAEAHTRKHYGK